MSENLYCSKQCREIDARAAAHLGIDSYQLMQRAGAAVHAQLGEYKRLLVVTGAGNNAGDGFVIARQAIKAGAQVHLRNLVAIDALPADAQRAAHAFLQAGGRCRSDWPDGPVDVVVDAIFGTGINRPVGGVFAEAIEWINAQTAPVCAVDIPSGLNADTGAIMGHAVCADMTVSVICLKPGLYTNDGRDCSGAVQLATLDLPEDVFDGIPAAARLIDQRHLAMLRQARLHNSHKGRFGHVLIAGGDVGMAGAVLLAGSACLRSGAGSVTVLSRAEHAGLITLHEPALMSAAFVAKPLQTLRKPVDVVAVGMGLGLADWGEQMIQAVRALARPTVFDADALNWLSHNPQPLGPECVITPHPAEAARLLDWPVSEVMDDRLAATQALCDRFACVTVLKGSGSVIGAGDQFSVCALGSANLATAGAGDVLSGMIAGLMAQGHSAYAAACLGVAWHAWVGQSSPRGRCLVASDLPDELHRVLQDT